MADASALPSAFAMAEPATAQPSVPANGGGGGGLLAAMRSASGLVGGGRSGGGSGAPGGGRAALTDKYMLGEELGRGAFGQVFKGLDTRSGEAVAIKQLALGGIPNEALAGIMGEIELLRGLNHPNIVKYIGSFKTRSHLYIIMEFMENGALSNIIKPSRFGCFPEPLVAMYISQVLAGLAYLHEQGVVHRDIKGANILTTKEGLVKLADFGVASRLGEIADEEDPAAIAVVGTPYWMAPEVIEMTSVSAAADIWSVGCLCLELLTGAPPYFDLQPMSALFRIVADMRPPLPDSLSPELRDFLLQCFHKDPAKRPDAKMLQQHEWLGASRRTLRASWQDTLRGRRPTPAMEPVSAVVDATLRDMADPVGASSSPTRRVSSSNGRGATTGRALLDGRPAAGDPLSVTAKRRTQPGTARRHTKSESPSKAANASQPLEAVMAQLGGSMASSAPGDWEGGNMASWLERQEAAAADASAPMPTSPQSALAAASPGQRKAAEVRRLLAALRPIGRAATRDVQPAVSAVALTDTVSSGPEGRAAFLEADGAAVLLELLDTQQPEVALSALRLTNAAAGDQQSLHALALQGLLPAVGSFTDRAVDHAVRVEAAAFLGALAAGPPAAVQLLVACQGLASLSNLIDDAAPDAGALAGSACNAIWAVLQAGGQAAMVSRCRACAAAGLPLRLVLLLTRLAKRPTANGTTPHGGAEGPSFGLRQSSAKSLTDGLLPGDGAEPGTAKRGSKGGLRATLGAPGTPTGLSSGNSSPAGGTAARGGGGGSFAAAPPPDADKIIMRAADLLLVMSHADTVTKASLARRETLLQLIEVAHALPPPPALQLLRALRALTADPALLLPLYDCGTIQLLEPFIEAGRPAEGVAQALAALDNLCKISRTRQEAAAVSGVVPHLVRLAAPQDGPPAEGSIEARLRERAVPMLCAMAHSTTRGRAALGASDGAGVLLGLLREPPYQALALDALAAWLEEDAGRLQPRLAQRDTLARLTALIAAHTPAVPGDTDALVAVLGPLSRLLRAGPRVSAEAGRSGLPPLLCELLKRPPALAALPLLQALRAIYEHHPRPKEFLVKWPIQESLRRLVAGGGADASQAVLVRRQAQSLLDAFRVNTVF